MDRRVAGVLALVLAVAAVVFVPRFLNPGVAGVATVAPMPTPPAVGSCVNTMRRSMSVVDCTQLHEGEVTATWIAEDPDRVREATDDSCAAHARDYLGQVVPQLMENWTLAVLTWETGVTRAPRAQRAEDYYGWNACVVRAPERGRYTGSIRNLADVTTRPAVFGSCQSYSVGLVPCTDLHDGERLADASGTWIDEQPGRPAGSRLESIEASLSGGCTAVAEAMTGAADPTYDGRLRIIVWVQELGQVPYPDDETRYATDYLASCEVSAVDGELTGSVVGVGDAELPMR